LDRTLANITQQAGRLKEVRKEELDFGDWVVVTTRNSTYSIRVLEGDCYSISGGWFDHEGLPTQDDHHRLHLGWQCHQVGHCGSLRPASGVW